MRSSSAFLSLSLSFSLSLSTPGLRWDVVSKSKRFSK
jgi:hypothetical protein